MAEGSDNPSGPSLRNILKIEAEHRRKPRFSAEDVIHYVMLPTHDSDIEELQDSDGEDEHAVWEEETAIHEINNIEPTIDTMEEDEDGGGTNDTNNTSPDTDPNNISSDDDPSYEPVDFKTEYLALHNEPTSSKKNRKLHQINGKSKKKDKPREHKFRWRQKRPVSSTKTFTGEPEPLPNVIKEPIDYFKMFWTDDITELIANETNLYSVQKTGRSIKTTFHEMEQLLGMQMLMGVVKMPKYMLYWMAGTRFAPIADLMTRKRYKDLRSKLHLVDNSTKDEPQNKDDRLFKIRPVLEKVRNNCIKVVVPKPVQSIDEQIIPSKAKTSGISQYNPRKPKKWGYKVFVRAGQSGLMYDFFLYTGKNSTGTEKSICASVVRKLCEHLPRKVNHKLAFDNWFTTLSLMLELKQEGLCVVGTFRTNRLENCPLLCDKDLKNCGRGSLDYRVDANSGFIVLKWNDNKPVHVTSSYATNEIVKDVQRFDRATKKYVQVPLPDIIAEYNSAMGGVSGRC